MRRNLQGIITSVNSFKNKHFTCIKNNMAQEYFIRWRKINISDETVRLILFISD
jgi:hypothetical protein